MNQYNSKNNINSFGPNKSIEERRWELLKGVKKGLEELSKKEEENETIINLIQSGDQFKNMKDKINNQQENLKLRLLIASRERNVYLEKLRKLEEYGENNEWNDKHNILKKIYEILYNDAN